MVGIRETEAAAFRTKMYRCEWLVELGSVDQYDQNFKPYSTEAFATVDAARARLAEVSFVQPGSLRVVPKDAPHGYCHARVRYREVEITDQGSGPDRADANPKDHP